MGYGHELAELSKRGDIQVCLQCDALSTGVPDRNDDGFVVCGGCIRKREHHSGQDPDHPGTGPKTKSVVRHRELTHSRFRALAIRASEHHHYALYGVMPETHSYYITQVAERLIGSPIS